MDKDGACMFGNAESGAGGESGAGERENAGCAETAGDEAARAPQALTVADLTMRLFSCFPLRFAEEWDRCGLLVGDGTSPVTGIALALDPHVDAIEKAKAAGCNVLLTHHPAYIASPERLVDRAQGGSDAAARATAAIKSGVALVAMHTNLDRSEVAGDKLAQSLGLTCTGRLLAGFEPLNALPTFGWAAAPQGGDPLSLHDLAVRCLRSYRVVPRVWGEGGRKIATIGIANGSSSSLADAIVESGVDCVVTGEISYHKACDVASAGISVIELGHDVSELPLVECLEDAVRGACGYDGKVEKLASAPNWWQPGWEER